MSLGADVALDDYLARNPTTGLLIARGDTMFFERYQYGRTDRHRFTSFSMAKTVTAMLIGIAIDEGRIRSVDDLAAAYVPALAGTEYGRTSLRHLLQMSSAVRFNERFSLGSTSDDVFQLILDTYARLGPGGVGAVTSFNERERPAGTKFSLRLGRDPGAWGSCWRGQSVGGRRVPAAEDLAADRCRSRRDVARRQLGPGGHLLLPERRSARLRSPWAPAGSRRPLARPPDHPGRVGSGCNHRALGPTASVARHGDAKRGLRLPDVDPPRRAQDVRAPGRRTGSESTSILGASSSW
jgi:hypothetical protein